MATNKLTPTLIRFFVYIPELVKQPSRVYMASLCTWLGSVVIRIIPAPVHENLQILNSFIISSIQTPVG